MQETVLWNGLTSEVLECWHDPGGSSLSCGRSSWSTEPRRSSFPPKQEKRILISWKAAGSDYSEGYLFFLSGGGLRTYGAEVGVKDAPIQVKMVRSPRSLGEVKAHQHWRANLPLQFLDSQPVSGFGGAQVALMAPRGKWSQPEFLQGR